jgi:hypothetical protein
MSVTVNGSTVVITTTKNNFYPCHLEYSGYIPHKSMVHECVFIITVVLLHKLATAYNTEESVSTLLT